MIENNNKKHFKSVILISNIHASLSLKTEFITFLFLSLNESMASKSKFESRKRDEKQKPTVGGISNIDCGPILCEVRRKKREFVIIISQTVSNLQFL